MDVSNLLTSLNDKQRDAVSAPLGNLLVLAGAGSGKTRVLVHRIAWLLEVERLSPYSILAVTFTNKAAGEMRERIENLLGHATSGMWVGTFHNLAHRLLRRHWQEAGLPEGFQILDADDQYRLIRRIMKSHGIDEKQYSARQVQSFINGKKDDGIRARDCEDYHDSTIQTYKNLYQLYEEATIRAGLVDFAELLLRAYELWRTKPEILQHYQQRFRHVLVDEFQDTNKIQYAWLTLLAHKQVPMMIVGDDDQSIYGWRGARIENIQSFSQDFAPTTTIRLEQNYRSTSNILEAANTLIANNKGRLGKNLWTSGDTGKPIAIYSAFNEYDEAAYIVNTIKQQRLQFKLKEIAILYRSNAQSRVLEEALLRERIPYRIYGGLRFFERAEIKDTLAYLRLVNHRGDDAAFERIINTPTRGIGERTLGAIRQLARDSQMSLWQAAEHTIQQNSLSNRACNAVHSFTQLINTLEARSENLSLAQQVELTIELSDLKLHYAKENKEKAETRLENLNELISAASSFIPEADDQALPLLAAFLSHAALEAGDTQSDPYSDCIQMMTLHTAKGLEFPIVFLAGLEEGLFPHRMSIQETSGRLEEERRLCYVGMTRAMQELTLSYAECRRLHGNEQYHKASRFIHELPSDCVEHIRPKTQVIKPQTWAQPIITQTASESGFSIGEVVSHPSFGDGVILNFEGAGSHERVQVQFANHGTKWLVLAYAKLTSTHQA